MFKSALVPLDGSIASRAAQSFAIELAGEYKILLEGIAILDVPTITAGAAAPVGGSSFKAARDQSLLEDARAKVTEFLEQFHEACSKAGVDHEGHVVEGRPYQAINRQSRRHDLIVIGRHTFFHFETQDNPGETLRELIRDCARPLIVVPEDRKPGTGTVVATDDKTPSAHAAQLFAELRLPADETVYVVAVDEDAEKARTMAEMTTEYLAARNCRAEAAPIVSSKSVAEVLLKHVESVGARMIVMGIHGDGGILHKLFFGPTALRVIRDTQVPVFVHH